MSHRIYCTESYTGNLGVYTLQFYGRELTVKQASAPTDGREYIQIGSNYYTEDWGEKEFAQGSTRKTIYDHGVEANGVTVYTEGTGSTATKEADCINLSIPASTHVNACAYANIDLTDYNVLGVKFGRTYTGGSYLSVYSQIPNYAQTGRQATKYSGVPISELTQTLDISNLNNSYYITSQCANNNSGGAASVDVVELWLE